ncbi:hypothetical protein AAFF_G00245090 [Aldrovandia affinis]|uniref:Antifreeze protein n=1 Tax=Aldrovandia affinis TaxID=143900 RepID=A0AAD7RDT4_9TELE|nr:hypothetical protein AAFF_G00245090 [Aldrovandia affinis]
MMRLLVIALSVLAVALAAPPQDKGLIINLNMKRLKQMMLPTTSNVDVATMNMAVLKAPDGIEAKSKTLPLQISSEGCMKTTKQMIAKQIVNIAHSMPIALAFRT